ncbi:carotenoid biosynthesis protein [Actinacidiphila oryziradicis]|uniref:carotenoid biosynthesis protein n=1 Tax=Actinacidiphila oryziradicis TaxID=2571141 RepID=UPI0023F1EB52|nr:carotenoid biosynthesis protein [Actinacidiphila oryziradicis]MCW2870034.1 carotenoid biosynthesis protein [Actinacidiphila oryziradicis]
MSDTPRSNRLTTLWAITIVIGLGLVLNGVIPRIGLLVILLQVAFALLHGAQRYGWRAIWVFVAAGLVISNILENLSIQAGFPFGHYHYTGGGKLFLVPWFIGPAYLATGYLAWIVATVLLGDVRRNSHWLTTIGTPVIAAFAMTAWDLSMDPRASTIGQTWIWENGGGFFGVPLGNFLGWTFTVYLFMQVFALYLRSRGPLPTAEPDRTGTSDLQGVLLYGLTTVSFFTTLFTGDHKTVTDAAGHSWQTADIYETSTLVTVYGMFFIAALALLRIAQQRTAAPAPTAAAGATKRAEPETLRPSA